MTVNGSNTALAEKLQSALAEKLGEKTAAASYAAMINGELVAACAVGTRDGDTANPAQVGDLFNIGSVSKVYCAAAVMKLVEQNKLGLDDPVYKYLPRLTMRDPRYKDITLRMCISHTSGLPGTMFANSFVSAWDVNTFYELCYDYFSKCKLKSDPGTIAAYCNDGFTLAEMTVAEVSGMSFTAFVQKHITQPIGAVSTCTAENNPDNRYLVRVKGMPAELITVIGAGGISTDISDCAKFGNMFLQPNGVFKPETLAETAVPQCKEYPKDTFSRDLGLGWDSVRFKNEMYDFGDGVLLKSGGTLEFLTYLLVSKKHNLSAALSTTNDFGIDVLETLCALAADTMQGVGTDIRLTADKPEPQKLPVPADWAEKYAGIYASYSTIIKAEQQDDGISLKKFAKGKWEDAFPLAHYDGSMYVSPAITFGFDSVDGTPYITQFILRGLMAMAQKVQGLPPADPMWLNRLGKKYIICDGKKDDLILGSMVCGVEIEKADDSGMLLLSSSGAGGTMTTPIITAGPYESDMFLTMSGNSRDIFPAYIYIKDGVEYMYHFGFNLIDAEALMPYGGRAEAGLYTLPDGPLPENLTAGGLRAVIMNDGLLPIYDSMNPAATLPEGGAKYLMLLA